MMNPVLRREAKTTLRSWKVFAIVTGYVSIVALGAGLFLYGMLFNSYDYSFDPESMMSMYVVLCAMQMGLMLIASPALTAGCISGERERQTLDLLLMTKMSPLSIVIGKMLASMGVLLLLLVATLPIFAVVFYFGGISLLALLGMMGYILLTACMAASLSIFFSCIFKKTVVSMVVVYVLVGGIFCLGSLIITALQQSMAWSMHQTTPSILPAMALLLCNPGVGFFSLVEEQIGFGLVGEIFRSYKNTSPMLEFFIGHYWLLNVIFDVVVIVLFLALAAWCIQPNKGRK